jgi:hypothetical protein
MEFQMDWSSGALRGDGVRTTIKTLADLSGLFRDATIALDRATIVYRVESWLPVSEGTTGGLFWGVTTLLPGKVGDEYFMTHGHFHDTRDWKAEHTRPGGRPGLKWMFPHGRPAGSFRRCSGGGICLKNGTGSGQNQSSMSYQEGFCGGVL